MQNMYRIPRNEPKEEDDISCHLQQQGMGTLLCRAARQTGDGTTNEVDPALCFNCLAGQVYRDVGCDSVSPKIQIYQRQGGNYGVIHSMLCHRRNRETDIDYCKICKIATADTTRQVVSKTRSLFETHGFYSAFKDIEKTRVAFRDGKYESAITHSISFLESTMRICHEKLKEELPAKKQVTDLWKSTRGILKFKDLEPQNTTSNLLGSLSGAVAALGGISNTLGDRHGKGVNPPDVTELQAELTLNVSATLATVILRRFLEKVDGENE